MDQDEKKDFSKEKKKIKTSTGLIAIFAAVVIFFGGALTYWTYNDPNSYSSSTDSTVVPTKVVEDAATADWVTYINTNYGFSFKYPKEWESTKVEAASEPTQGEYGTDIVLKVLFLDPTNSKQIDCANNEFQNWADKSPTKTECDPILSALTKAEKDKLVGPKTPKNIYVRVYKDDPSLALKDWLYQKFHKPNSELEKYQVGKEIELGGVKGYQSSIGCCAFVDNNYVIKANGYILSLGTNYFENNITDTELPAIFTQIAGTFKVTDLTADWKTYTNKDTGFTLKYPTDWTINTSSQGTGGATLSLTSPQNAQKFEAGKSTGGAGSLNLFDISVFYYTSIADVEKNNPNSIQYQNLKELLDDTVRFTGLAQTSIFGVTGYGGIEHGNVDSYVYILPKNDAVYKIDLNNDDALNKLTTTEKQIVGTFQFTK